MSSDLTEPRGVDPLDPGEAPEARPSAGEAAETPAPAKPTKVRKKRSWRRRLWLTLIVLLVIGVVLRIAVQVAFPIVLKNVAAGYGLNADYDKLRMGMLSGDVGIGRLEFKSRKTGDAFATAHYVRATISPLKLLIGKLEVWRVEADGVDLHVTREADGTMPVLGDILTASASTADAAPEPQASPSEKAMIDLTSPAEIESFRLQHLRLHLTDKSLSPPVEAMVQLDVRVDDIGSPDRPTQFFVGLYSDPVLDALTVEGQGRVGGAYIDADVTVGLKGLHLKPLAQYLEPVGIRPVAYDLAASGRGTLRTSPASLVAAMSQIAAATRPATEPAPAPATMPTPGTLPAIAAAAPMTMPAEPTFPAEPKPAEFVAGSLKLSNLSLLADGKEAAACDRFEIDLAKANLGLVQLSRILVDGVRASALRNADGNVVAAGLELIPVASDPPATQPAAETKGPATTPAPATARVAALRASLDELLVKDVRVSFQDRFVAAATEPLVFQVDHLALKNIVLDPDRPDAQMAIAGAFTAPGIVKAISIEGTARPFADARTLRLRFEAGGIAPTLLQPYLDFLGLQSNLKDASFTSTLDAEATVEPSGKLKAAARVGDISFRDGDELFGMQGVKFDKVELNPLTGALHVGEIEVTGPTLTVAREADGSFSGFGFRTKPATPYPARAERPTTSTGVQLARLELDRFVWKDIGIRFDDRAAVPPAVVEIGDARVEVADLLIDLTKQAPPPDKICRIQAWLLAPQVAERLEVKGTLLPDQNRITAKLDFSGDGITAAGLSGYLKTVGVEPLLGEGMFFGHLEAELAVTETQQLKASVAIQDVVYADGQNELAGVDRVSLDEIAVQGDTLSLGKLQVQRPRASVTLEQGGSIVAGGFRYTPPAAAPSSSAAPVVADAALSAGPATAPAAVATASPPAATPRPAAPTAVRIGGISLTDAALTLSDLSAARPFQTVARANAEVGALTLGRDGPPADVDLRLKADGIVDQVTIKGNVLANPKSQGATFAVDVSGLRGTALAAYLPDGVAFDLNDGRLTTTLQAGVEQLDQGGFSAKLLVDKLDYRDGQDGPTLLKLDQFRVEAPRLDPTGDAVTIDGILLSGLEMETRKAADGSLKLLGLSVQAGSAASAPAAPAAPAATAPAAAPVVKGAASAAPGAAAPADAAAIVAKARKALPLVTLNHFDLNVSRIGYLDLTSPDNQPLTLADLRFRASEKIMLLGPDPAGQPPAKFELTGRADPLIGQINLKAQVTPFAQRPALSAEVKLSGINGAGLFTVAPQLRDLIDPAELTNGEFTSRFEATAKLDRRGPMDVDFGKGFDVEAVVQGIELRSAPGADVSLGLEEIRVEDAQIRPVKDDAGNRVATSVRVKAVDVTKPMGQIVRDRDGVRVAGLLVKLPSDAATQPSAEPAVAAAPKETPSGGPPATTPVADPSPGAAPAVAAKPAGEVRIDKLTVSGIDFRLIDRSVDPTFVLPLTALDVDVRDLSNFALYEPDRPIRFSLALNAGKVTLPKKLKGGIAGAIGDATSLLGGKKVVETPEWEERELFSQIAATGRLSLYPQPDGYAKVNVTGFELASVGGYAKQQGIDLAYGTFDLPLDLRGDGRGGFVVDTRPAFSDLNVSEPPNGPIFRFLALPAPLDAAIAALEAADKSITIPVRGVTVTPDATGAYTVGGVGKQIAPAITSVFATAVLSSPAKAVTGAASIVGLDALFAGDDKPEPPVVLSFPSGYTGLEPVELAKVRALAERMKREPELTLSVKHELGAEDLNIAQRRANPSTSEAEAMAYALRQRKVELTQLRSDVAAATRTQLAAGGAAEAKNAVEQLRAIDRELSHTEDALDRMYDLLRPGAERQAPRRTRVAALDLGQERLDAIRAVLVSAGVPGLTDRLKATKPAFGAGDSKEGGTVTIALVRVKK